MAERSLRPEEARRALAAIAKGHQLDGTQLSASDLDRAQRILTGELSPEGARAEMEAAMAEIIDDGRKHPGAVGEQPATVAADSNTLVRRLIIALGPTLVSTLAGATQPGAASGWSAPDGPTPDAGALLRLRCAHVAWLNVSAAEGDDVARAWFVGGNPWLREDTPITAIREGRFGDVAIAVKACVHDSFSG